VLGKMIESSLLQSLMYFKGSFLGFFNRPIAGSLLALAMLLLILAIVASVKNKRGILADDAEV